MRGRGDLKLKVDASPNAPGSFLKPNDKNYRGVVYAMRPLYCSKVALCLGTRRGGKKRIMREIHARQTMQNQRQAQRQGLNSYKGERGAKN